MSYIYMSHVTHMHESCHTYTWVMSYIYMSHVTHMHESCHAYTWVMSYIRNESRHHSIMSHTWIGHTQHISHVTLVKGAGLWMGSRPTFPYDDTHIHESWHTYTWDVSVTLMKWVTLTSYHVTHVQESCHTFEWCHTCAWVMSHICISPVTHIHESRHTYT